MRALPQWFELEGGLLELVEAARTSPTLIAAEEGADVGFLTLKAQTRQAAEITVRCWGSTVGPPTGGLIVADPRARTRRRR